MLSNLTNKSRSIELTSYRANEPKKGFTLLELLIVVAIIAILALIVIIVLDPAETLKKSRDAQRLADMTTLKTAIGVYTTTTSTSPITMETISTVQKNFLCKGSDTDDNNYDGGNDRIWYSLPYDLNGGVTTIIDSTLDGGGPLARQVSQNNNARADGNGWLPIPLNSITGGSPISSLPVDPINQITNLSAVADTDFVYRYSCSQKTLRYEIDSQLESASFTETQNLRKMDGGNNQYLYEIGTDLNILGVLRDF